MTTRGDHGSLQIILNTRTEHYTGILTITRDNLAYQADGAVLGYPGPDHVPQLPPERLLVLVSVLAAPLLADQLLLQLSLVPNPHDFSPINRVAVYIADEFPVTAELPQSVGLE